MDRDIAGVAVEFGEVIYQYATSPSFFWLRYQAGPGRVIVGVFQRFWGYRGRLIESEGDYRKYRRKHGYYHLDFYALSKEDIP
jgi:hypothetical protein